MRCQPLRGNEKIKRFKMIDNYNDMSISLWREIRETLEDMGEASELEVQVALISLLSGMEEDEIRNLPLKEYSEMAAKTRFLMQQPNVKAVRPRNLTINGKKYDLVDDIKDLTTGQYIDYQTYMQDNEDFKNLAKVLSVFIVPKGKTYNEGYDVEDVIRELDEHLSIQIALGVCFFFREKYRSWLNLMQASFKRKMMRMRRKERNPEAVEKMEEIIRMMDSLKDIGVLGDG